MAPIHSVFLVTEKEDSRWWPWMHRLKRIRNNVHTLSDQALAYAPGSASCRHGFCPHPQLGCAIPVVNRRSYLIIWSRPVNAKQRPGQVFRLIWARKSNNVSLALTAGCETAETRLITGYICNLRLIEHKQAKAAKVNGVRATEMPGHLFCRFRIYSWLTR